MAMTSQQRSAKAAEKRRQLGEVELRHRVRPGIFAMIKDLMSWGALGEIAELIQLLIMNVHALGPDGARQFLAVPRHKITISENVAHKLRATGAAEAERLDQEES